VPTLLGSSQGSPESRHGVDGASLYDFIFRAERLCRRSAGVLAVDYTMVSVPNLSVSFPSTAFTVPDYGLDLLVVTLLLFLILSTGFSAAPFSKASAPNLQADPTPLVFVWDSTPFFSALLLFYRAGKIPCGRRVRVSSPVSFSIVFVFLVLSSFDFVEPHEMRFPKTAPRRRGAFPCPRKAHPLRLLSGNESLRKGNS